jgi:hypothetical protein
MSMLDLWVVDGSQSKVTDVPVNCILLNTRLHHASTTMEIDRPSYKDGGLSEHPSRGRRRLVGNSVFSIHNNIHNKGP